MTVLFSCEYPWFCFVIEPLSSEHEYSKYWQSCFNAVFLASKQRRWTYVDPTLSFNQVFYDETTLGHLHWIDVIHSTLFQRCLVNVKTTWINIRRLNFHFQQYFNDERNNDISATMNRRNSIDVDSTLFCHLLNNVDNCTSLQLSFSAKYQRSCVYWRIPFLRNICEWLFLFLVEY